MAKATKRKPREYAAIRVRCDEAMAGLVATAAANAGISELAWIRHLCMPTQVVLKAGVPEMDRHLVSVVDQHGQAAIRLRNSFLAQSGFTQIHEDLLERTAKKLLVSLQILTAPRQLVLLPQTSSYVERLGPLTRMLPLDVTWEEHAVLKQETAARGMTISDHVRALIASAPMPQPVPPVATIEMTERWRRLLVEWAQVDPNQAALPELVQHARTMDAKLALLVDALMTRAEQLHGSAS